MQNIKAYLKSATVTQRFALCILFIAAAFVIYAAFAFPTFGIVALFLLGAFAIAGAIATLIVYPVKRK